MADLNAIAANAALKEALGSSTASTSSFPFRVVERHDVISEGSLVVIFETYESLSFVYAEKGAVFSNRNGVFHHDDFIGKPFGSKLESRASDGTVFLLRPTSELWSASLPHRTQIVHQLDQAYVTMQLNLRPGCTVLESGTGSGAMSTSIARCVAPSGHLHTYEFNAARVDAARKEFAKNKLDHLVTVHHKDVCGKGTNDLETAGFDVPNESADAIFLDLPEPWLAVPAAALAIKKDGRICSYSPCIEQSQKATAAFMNNGFHSVKTIEVRLKEFYVDVVEIENVTSALPFYVGPAEIDRQHKKRKAEEEEGEEKEKEQKKKVLRARPAAEMRGHTAFLTFATRSLK
jgi:tRNA (adenine57-N1/adenine58-N1)-methyltransferase